MKILSVNVGSTSFKYQLYEIEGSDERVLARGKVDKIGSQESTIVHQAGQQKPFTSTADIQNQTQAVEHMLALLTHAEHGCLRSINTLDGVGFKAVAAGQLREPTLVTKEVLEIMTAYIPVAPLHNPAYLAVMRGFKQAAPDVSLVAVFETGFHSTLPDYAYIYSTPYEWFEQHDLRRYGYHGASFTYISQQVPKLLGRSAQGLRHIACHLGGSSAICALKDGKSVDISSGFSPQAGLPMGTRCGDIDPFIIPFIAERESIDLESVAAALAQRGGLAGISGLGDDVPALEEAAAAGHYRASLAINHYAYLAKKYIGAFTTVLGGVDVLSFSGGIGENSPDMRKHICAGLEYLGLELDDSKNNAARGSEQEISTDQASAAVLVIPTNEEIIVARETAQVLQNHSSANDLKT